ncbi:MAG TPA: OmpA family protein [Myxococcales bacterium]|nr:OmpA family protein [Myxococcales bacterium]
MRRSAALLALVGCALAGAARADSVKIDLKSKEIFGKGVPRLDIHILEPIVGFEVKLKRSDGRELNLKGGGPPGVTRTVTLDQPEGKFTWEGVIFVRLPKGGEYELPVKFDTELMGPLRMTFVKEELDLKARKAVIKLSRPAARATIEVQMDTGVQVRKESTFNGAEAGTPLVLEWPPASGSVMTIRITAWDTADFYNGVELSPWQVDIIHDDLEFDTGRADIRKDQQPKLDTAYEKLAEVAGKYGKLAPIRLFILGHTDTVGDKDANRELSRARARSIGAYFRKKGARIPILFDGYGEEALAVPTKDETPEEKNRSAEYIVAIDDPVLKNPPFPPQWRKL